MTASRRLAELSVVLTALDVLVLADVPSPHGGHRVGRPGPTGAKADEWLKEIDRARNPDGSYGPGPGKARTTALYVVAQLQSLPPQGGIVAGLAQAVANAPISVSSRTNEDSR